MAVYHKAVRKLIPPGSNDPRIKPRVAILHVAVSNSDSLYDYFAHRSGGIESHFYIRDDGTVEQYRDTDWEADANYRANPFAVSIETEGMGEGRWTKAQVESIKALLSWLHAEHGIPLEVCKTPFGSGVGYHTLFGAPSEWTPVSKSCPGPGRIKQFYAELVPWMNTLSVEYTRGGNLDHAEADIRRAKRRTKGKARRKRLRALLRSIRDFPKWVKR